MNLINGYMVIVTAIRESPLRVVLTAGLILAFAWSCEAALAAGGGGPKVRAPAAAGLFYPKDAAELRKMVKTLLKGASGLQVPGKIRGLVCPHAGYVYSGIVAAAGYRQIDPSIKRVILLGPSHHFPLRRPSIPRVTAYHTPLGDIPLAGFTSELRRLPLFKCIPEAHHREHSLEVQLPFLQVVLKDFEIVPVLTNAGDPKALAAALAPHVNENTLVVASSDLSHYYSYDTAIRLDRICTDAITRGSFSDMPLCQACGKHAILTLMHIARMKGWQAMLIDYKNSGDTAGGKDRVVGYASIGFADKKEISGKMKNSLSAREKKALIRLARSAIEARLKKGTKVERPQAPSPALTANRGCFVTLHKDGRLRGCIGTIEPVSPLVECVERNAENAAFDDPRFPPLSEEELPDTDIEISVLSVPEALPFKNGEELKQKLQPRVHGVILSRGFHRATFLPQVWEELPDKERFLEHLCLKGGMPADAWKDPATSVQVYEAEVFGEKDF